MKLLLILIFTGILQVSASVYSQQTKMTFSFSNKSVKEVLTQIEESTDFRFFYNENFTDLNSEVSIEAKNNRIDEILNILLASTNITYRVLENNLIVITPKSMLQGKQISGIITDASTGEFLPGVYVKIEGTNAGTVTNDNGKYSLEVPDENVVLLFSFIGYNTERVSVEGKTMINISLIPDIQSLEEVVVIGYGSTKVKDLTTAVSTVKTDKLSKSGTDSNIDMMLVGRVPGLNMTLNSAQPGSRVDINIRGSISPNGNNSPLYVIDGVPVTVNSSNIGDVAGSGSVPMNTGLDQSPLNTLNPNDIESINVLKDASAAAIYGSAAANGVIIITTKRGSSGGLKVSYDGSHTFSYRKSYKDHLYNAQSFMKYHNLYYHERQAVTNNVYPYRSSTGYTDFNNDGLFDIDDYTTAYNSVSDAYTATDIANAKTFNWIDYIMDDAWATEHNLSLNGGNEKSKFFASYNYYSNDGLLKNSGLRRNNFRFNFDQNLYKWLDFNLSFNYSRVNTDNESSGDLLTGSGIGTTITGAFAMTPYVDNSIDPATGKYAKGLNEQQTSPAGMLAYTDQTKNQRIFVSPSFTFKLAKGLTFKVIEGYDSQFSRRDHYIPIIAGNYLVPDGLATTAFSENVNNSTEGFFNLNKAIGDHRLEAVLGAGYYFTYNQTNVAQSAGFFTDSFLTDKLQAGSNQDKRFTGSSHAETTKLSQFGRLSYTYKDRYTLLGTLRRDGSSYFAENHKWGVFPSISGAWRISEEDWAHSELLTSLKLRAGYGTAGNEPNSANSLSVYAADELTGAGTSVAYGLITAGGYLGGVQVSTAANPNLKWETDKTINIGLDFGFYNQRIFGSLDYFNRIAEDLLDYKTLPSNGMLDYVIANVGSTQARGWEFVITTLNVKKPNIVWQTDVNFSYTRYRWKERNPDLILNSWVPVDADMSAIYGWETDGIFKSYDEINAYKNANGDLYQPKAMPGNIKYVDNNEDGVLDDKDNHLLGLSDAPWKFGLNNMIQYKNFSLTCYLYGAAGNIKTRSDRSTRLGAATGQGNGWSDNIDRYWTVFNTGGDWPGLGSDFTSLENRTGGTDDFWYMNGAYLKLRYVTLNYNLSEDIISRFGLGSLGISLTGQNLLTITGYKGYDPEVSIYSYPQCYSFTMAVRATF